jgi:beta-glucosidase
VIALFADYLPNKGRCTLREDTVAAIRALAAQAEAMHRQVVLVGLGDPRWVQQLAMAVPTVIAWNGDRVMQQAAGRGLLRKR